jgi:hypothetical protein
MKLLSTGNPKTLKGMSQGFMTYILHLAPSDVSGHNTCPKATAGCKAACLNTAGQGGMIKKGETTNNVQKARIRKTVQFFFDREQFMFELVADINLAIKQSAKKGFIPVFRLNGTSDISWEKYEVDGADNIFALFPSVQFYDYTKVLGRKVSHIPNYHLTFSQADGNDADVAKAIAQGMNVTVVFDKVPAQYKGSTVFDGDETDLRFLDPKGVVVGLKAKGKAKKDTTGFVVYLQPA